MPIDPNLSCGHPHDCYSFDSKECGWCLEIRLTNQAYTERDEARKEAADERAARRVQAKEYAVDILKSGERGYHEGREEERADVLEFCKIFGLGGHVPDSILAGKHVGTSDDK
jgi:hypothetical protein